MTTLNQLLEAAPESEPDLLSPDDKPSDTPFAYLSDIPVHFAQAPPSSPTADTAPMVTRPVTGLRRKIDWYLWGVLALLLSSAAVCIIRLLEAVQP